MKRHLANPISGRGPIVNPGLSIDGRRANLAACRAKRQGGLGSLISTASMFAGGQPYGSSPKRTICTVTGQSRLEAISWTEVSFQWALVLSQKMAAVTAP